MSKHLLLTDSEFNLLAQSVMRGLSGGPALDVDPELAERLLLLLYRTSKRGAPPA